MAGKMKRTKKAKRVFSALNFQIIESYKKARTGLVYSVAKKGCKKFIFTSPYEGEGKTTTSVNIAMALAQQVNTKVIIIDGDLRRPQTHKALDVYPELGVTNYLNFECSLEDIIARTDTKNLDFISYGAIPPNPSELLASEMMVDLIEKLENIYDFIIIDTPPVNMVVDVIPLVRLVDGVVLVVKDGVTTYPEIDRAVEALKVNGAKIAGIIANKVAPQGNGKAEYSVYSRKSHVYRSDSYK